MPYNKNLILPYLVWVLQNDHIYDLTYTNDDNSCMEFQTKPFYKDDILKFKLFLEHGKEKLSMIAIRNGNQVGYPMEVSTFVYFGTIIKLKTTQAFNK